MKHSCGQYDAIWNGGTSQRQHEGDPNNMSTTERGTESTTGNWYLEGNFAPVTEEVTANDLEVEGRIPPALAGRYIRTGPNPVAADPSNHHWFVGDGMLHGVRLAEGKAEWYRNRYVLSPDHAERTGREPVPTPGDPLFPGSGNTNVIHHAGRTFAINELTLPYEIDRELETIRKEDFGGPLWAGINAHPKFDPVTGDMHVMAYSFAKPWLQYHVIDAGGRLIRTEQIAVGGPIMVHDMGLTETQVIALDLPVVFDLDLAMNGRSLPYGWNDDYQARVGLMPRDGTGADTRWIDLDPCYVFHPLNAYDTVGDDGRSLVIMDVVRHPTVFKTDHDGPNDGEPRLERWALDADAGTAKVDVVSERPQEFPRADERRAGRPHRFGYVSAFKSFPGVGPGEISGAAILKHDLVAGTTASHEFAPGRDPGEFVFVPASDDAAEDEGWLMGYVYDAASNRTDLVVLDASSIASDPVAVVHLPTRVPVGFHGNWIPDRALP